MVDPKAPNAATRPMAIIQRTRVGYTVELWQPPAEGWTLLEEGGRFASLPEAGSAASMYVARHFGALAHVLDLPGARSIFDEGRDV